MQIADELVDLGDRLVFALFLGLEDAPVELDRAEEQVEHRGGELDAAEAEVIEQLFELVRERRHAVGAEEPGQPLERVHRAEDVVDEARIDAPGADPLVEPEQIAAQTLDDLLRLGEELVARAVTPSGIRCSPRVSARSPPPEAWGQSPLGGAALGEGDGPVEPGRAGWGWKVSPNETAGAGWGWGSPPTRPGSTPARAACSGT